jgi:hypothetical protein
MGLVLARLLPNITNFGDYRFHHGPRARLGSYFDAPELGSIEAFLEAAAERNLNAIVNFDKPTGESAAVQTDARIARGFYGTGLTINMMHSDRVAPAIRRLMSRIERELGFPTGQGICQGFVSTPGIGTRTHFDRSDVLAVQLIGKKRWWVARNRHLRNPPANYAMNSPKDAWIADVRIEFPTRLPDDAEEILMVPGSVLYMPASTWHHTQTVEESFHLSLAFDGPRVAEVVGDGLRRLLSLEDAWRARVPADPEDAARALAAPLAELADRLRAMDPRMLLPRPPGLTWYRIPDGIHLAVRDGHLVASAADEELAEIPAEPEFLPICRRLVEIAAEGRDVCVIDFLDVTEAQIGVVETILGLLEENELLSRA